MTKSLKDLSFPFWCILCGHRVFCTISEAVFCQHLLSGIRIAFNGMLSSVLADVFFSLTVITFLDSIALCVHRSGSASVLRFPTVQLRTLVQWQVRVVRNLHCHHLSSFSCGTGLSNAIGESMIRSRSRLTHYLSKYKSRFFTLRFAVSALQRVEPELSREAESRFYNAGFRVCDRWIFFKNSIAVTWISLWHRVWRGRLTCTDCTWRTIELCTALAL